MDDDTQRIYRSQTRRAARREARLWNTVGVLLVAGSAALVVWAVWAANQIFGGN